MEFIVCQALVIKYKAIVFPEQAFDFIAVAISEGIEMAVKRIMPKLLLDQDRQPLEGLSKIDGIPVKVDRRQSGRRAHDRLIHCSNPINCPARVRLLWSIPETLKPLGSETVKTEDAWPV